MNVQALLSCPHVLKVYGAFEDDTFIYMVQQLADQGDIYKTYLAQRVRLSEKDLVLKIIRPLLLAIEHAHERGVIHRCAAWSPAVLAAPVHSEAGVDHSAAEPPARVQRCIELALSINARSYRSYRRNLRVREQQCVKSQASAFAQQ